MAEIELILIMVSITVFGAVLTGLLLVLTDYFDKHQNQEPPTKKHK